MRRLVFFALLASTPAAAGDFVLVAVHPDAAAQPPSGRTLLTLKAWNGRLYAGYGDYGNNTGPIGIRAFDPATAAFGPLLLDQATEAIHLYREVADQLLAPHTDPLAGESTGGFAQGTPGAPDDGWRDRLLVTGVHFYDVSMFTDSEVYLVGSRGSAAAVWRSDDRGATFPDSPVLSQTPPTGFSRYYFAGIHAGLLYVQASGFDASKVWDGLSWSDGPDLVPEGGVGWHPERFAEEMVYQASHAGLGASLLYTFDGSLARRLLAPPVYDFAVDGSELWAITARFVPVPDSSSGGYYEPEAIVRTTDLCSFTELTRAVPADARSLVPHGGALHLGGREARLFAWSDPLAPSIAAPPFELRRLKAVKRGSDVALVAESLLAPGGCETYTALVADTARAATIEDFAPFAAGLSSATWTHPEAVDDGLSHSYLLYATSPHGDGPTGR